MTREEAITIIRTVEYMACEEDDFPDGADEAIDMAIEALEANRPKGEWIEEKKRNFLDTRLNVGIEKKEITGKGYHTYLNVRCTNCNKVTMVDETIIYSYCPHCGARTVSTHTSESQ